MPKIKFLSGNALKIIAALTMLIDHIGYMLFPRVIILRIIGRLAFPIFAFMIAEGCKHTRNKLRYILTVGIFAAAVQIVYGVVMRSWKMSVLVTFTLAILLVYLFQFFKDCLFDKHNVKRVKFIIFADICNIHYPRLELSINQCLF